MGRLLFALCLLGALNTPKTLRAQNTPFSSPALDSNCYFPQIGVPNQIDTVYGDSSYEGLGAMIHNLGPNPNGTYGKMLIGNYVPDNVGLGPSFLYSVAKVQTGPSFNLHSLQAKAQKILLDPTDLRFAHLHNRATVDIFDAHLWRIYWADSNGDYDSTRFTALKLNVVGDRGIVGSLVVSPYITHMTSDTVDDIVFGSYTIWHDESKDTVFLALYRGGASLADKETAYEDTCAKLWPFFPPVGHSHSGMLTTQGDYRGVGRDDGIFVDDSANLWYFRNDRPFDLAALARAITLDTLMVLWQNPHWIQYRSQYSFFTMPVLPRGSGDRSVDFMPILATNDERDSSIFIFRGGPDFGSHRLFLDSADFLIRNPRQLDGEFRDYNIDILSDAGDMTGTGNHVLYVDADNGGVAFETFYATGKALDEKMDIFCSFAAGALGDSLTTNGDNLGDFLMGLPGYTSDDDLFNGKRELGSLWLLYGSKNIPVHLNPKWADAKQAISMSLFTLSLSPNPAQSFSVADMVWPESETVTLTICNIIGTAVQTRSFRLEAGESELHLSLGSLAPGVYYVFIEGKSGWARSKLAIIR